MRGFSQIEAHRNRWVWPHAKQSGRKRAIGTRASKAIPRGQTNTGRSVSCWTHSRTTRGSASFASSVISARNAGLPSCTCCSQAFGSRENWIRSQKCGGIPALWSATTSHSRTFTPGATRPFHNKGKGSNEGHSKCFGCNTDNVPYNAIKQRGQNLSYTRPLFVPKTLTKDDLRSLGSSVSGVFW